MNGPLGCAKERGRTKRLEIEPVHDQSRTQSPQAFWSAGRRLERLWDNGII